MGKLETRLLPVDVSEVRMVGEDEKTRLLQGYGIVYNRRTKLYDNMYEIVRPGAATEFLRENPDIKCALNHDRRWLFGRTKSGTLTVTEDEKGVMFKANPPDAQWARDALVSIERGDIDGASFTFLVEPNGEKVTKQADGSYLREILRISKIGELGPVTDPQYIETSAEYRSAQDVYDSFTAGLLQRQEEADQIAENQRTLELRKKSLELRSKI